MIGHEFLHAPGPTHVPERVLNAMRRQPLDLVDGRIKELARSCFDDLKTVFRTEGHVFVYAANGHGGWEAALSNICVPGDVVLVPEVGHFSSAWADHARALGIVVETIPADGRRAVDPDKVEAHLRADRAGRIKAVLAVQVDTATSLANDLPAIRAAMDAARHPALLVADTIASLAAMPFEMDAWGVDVAVAASQKALMCPPGLAFVAANDKALARSQDLPRHARYWDWGFRVGDENYLKFNGTMPEQGMFGLREALDIIAEQGLPAIHRRHRRIAGAVHAAVEAWGEAGAVSLNAVEPAERAPTVTAIRTHGFDPDRLRTYVRETIGVSVAGGLGSLSGLGFRIGHLGDVNEPMILACLSAVELAFVELKVPHGRNGVRAAIEHLAAERAVPAVAPTRAAA